MANVTGINIEIPSIGSGDANKIVSVNNNSSGYELINQTDFSIIDEFQLTKNALFTTHDSTSSRFLGDGNTTTVPVYNLKFNPGNNNDQDINHLQLKGGFRQSQSCIISCGGAASDDAAVWGGVGIQSYDTYEDENRGLFLNKFGGNVYCGGTNLTSFISNVNSNNAGYITANSTNTLTNKSISYDQLTGVPVIEDGGLTEKNFTSSLKDKLDSVATNANLYLLPIASSSLLGGIKLGYSQNSRNYPVVLDNQRAYVNVPWTDTTSYSQLTGTPTVGNGGLTQVNFTTALKTKLDGIASNATNVTNNSQISNGRNFITADSTVTLLNKTINCANVGTNLQNVSNDEIASDAGINATKIADGNVSNTEFQQLNNNNFNTINILQNNKLQFPTLGQLTYQLYVESAGRLVFTNGGYSWGRWNRAHHYDVYSASNFTGSRDFFLNYFSGAQVKIANQVVVTSDDRIKTNEKYIENATETLMKLKPQTYTKGPNLGEVVDDSGNVTKAEPISRMESGLIAQDVWYDAPELRHLISHSEDAEIPHEKPFVNNDPTQDPDYSTWGSMSAGIGYEGLIAYLIKAIQELNTELTAVKKQLENNNT